jgi:hypothetical protein
VQAFAVNLQFAAAPAGIVKSFRPPLSSQFVASLPGPAPTNVTLTPASPTNITIQWSPAPGAVGYVISRNDAPDIAIDPNAGFRNGNRFIYTDMGRKPATLHNYSVTAQFPAPTRPGRSAAVQAWTPAAAAPANFSAKFTSANAITLSWSSVPLAESYRVYRFGGNRMQPALFNAQGTSYVDQNLPSDQTQFSYAVYAVLRLANGEMGMGRKAIQSL